MTRHSPAMPAVHAPKPKRRNLLADLVRSREATLFVVLIALIAAPLRRNPSS
jgi:rhamnose transport system permease protein